MDTLRKSQFIGVACTPDQKRELEKAANAAGFRLAEWVRMAALQVARSSTDAGSGLKPAFVPAAAE